MTIGFGFPAGTAETSSDPKRTAFETIAGNPVIAIVTEMDALPEGSQTPGSIQRKPLVDGAPGHMEGHNVMAGVARRRRARGQENHGAA
jgi:metal-dependent amidase/aminoacylase/carboxypeptidase family protein